MTLYVHIGRGKAGSSTIQKFAFDNRAALRRLGLIYPDIGRFRSGHLPLSRALHSGQSDQLPLQQFRTELLANPTAKFLISSEHLFSARRHSIENLVRGAAGHEVRVIAYIRDYPAWIRSVYAQKTRTGKNTRNFDAFFVREAKGLSALPALTGWAAVLGWHNLRVRSLDPDSLCGGKLTLDLLDAVGVQAPIEPLPEPADQNPAPPWPILELHRAIAESRAALNPPPHDRAAEKRLAKHLAACIERNPASLASAEYLSAAQAQAATARFNKDIAVLNVKTGSNIPPLRLDQFPGRPFLPEFGAVSPQLRRAFFRRLTIRIALARVLPIKDRPGLGEITALRDRLRDRFHPGSDSSVA